ncbi:hypothetical protein Bbelb_217810 [Branchiostoma belcheri]|nr:hypothetical protein Bbelb_217810 [Branchiostoma belcheri]
MSESRECHTHFSTWRCVWWSRCGRIAASPSPSNRRLLDHVLKGVGRDLCCNPEPFRARRILFIFPGLPQTEHANEPFPICPITLREEDFMTSAEDFAHKTSNPSSASRDDGPANYDFVPNKSRGTASTWPIGANAI